MLKGGLGAIAESDEFTKGLGLQWQANPKASWSFVDQSKGSLRLYSDKISDEAKNYWDVPNILLQKFPAEDFVVTTRLVFKPNQPLENEKAGLIIMGQSYASLSLKNTKEGVQLVYAICTDASKGNPESEKELVKVLEGYVYFRVKITKGAKCLFGYSLDGKKYEDLPENFQAVTGRWVGAKVGLFCTRTSQVNDAGYADFDWFRIEEK